MRLSINETILQQWEEMSIPCKICVLQIMVGPPDIWSILLDDMH